MGATIRRGRSCGLSLGPVAEKHVDGSGAMQGNRMKRLPDTGLESLYVGRFGVAFGSAA
ncbi:hypothetical protein [Azotobacter vinelandii]|uniref:hypothetical protein n=1 Tax=Azotobacter vinelandii TaxID=354 RepID=UPI002666EF73|nr:hypothetical protein [Azotobacter vinelandii]WKN24124.1 hypothetical protein AVAEIV_002266 [Azotobacter vinelandii]